jgi:hypothetical protein
MPHRWRRFGIDRSHSPVTVDGIPVSLPPDGGPILTLILDAKTLRIRGSSLDHPDTRTPRADFAKLSNVVDIST